MLADFKYAEYLKRKKEEWESLCKRCGACCGAFDDPCQHLKKGNFGKYYCTIYSSRFGIRQTITGTKFKCVPIEEILDRNWFGDRQCAYKINLKMPWLK
jgi:uncharacterized cysteine cluster protein YcgN (CxxCxxCC family)